MDTWLIFHDFQIMRRGDGVQYVKHIIGFVFVLSGRFVGKSANWLKGNFQVMHKPYGQPRGI